ncbi:MAG: Rne/Rng family ribonuclease [Devosia sp.]
MSNKMLVDATHAEETRVVVVRDKRVEDFDFEAASRKPLRGNIYLAKVTRVEPSLQAAFVEYGGNRHGFLAFSEIHPDYYQIPKADRAALDEELEEVVEEEPTKPRKKRSRSKSSESTKKKAEEADAKAASEETADGDGAENAGTKSKDDAPALAADAVDIAAADDAPTETASDDKAASDEAGDQHSESAEAAAAENHESAVEAAAPDAEAEQPVDAAAAAPEAGEAEEEAPAPKRRRSPRKRTQKSDDGLADPAVADDVEPVEEPDVASQGTSDALEEIPERKRRAPKRTYKIQEVIKRRQIIVVQVVKEERGTKGAALTTYLSLAGRYSVLMPNTDRGGGVSRKITDAGDRKRLKGLVAELEVPTGMGIILRTAGAARTKSEIRRDFEYLLRLWESVRDLTLQSYAPQLVYEEGSLVKRAIRDLYSKEIDEVLVAGDGAYREAKDFMRMLMPSHAKNVKPYKEATPIFTAYAVEPQLDAMFSPQVTLPSGGYIVINPTEALVAIDVNSGRSTKEHSIEDTALKTNLEAADEVARQLRLRDLAGLIVIDFIDMDEKRHNRSVEKRLKDALKLDRSRIQVGRISSFGLLEMSRQRIRQGVVESSSVACEVCAGTGSVRSTQSVALHCLRHLEVHLLKNAERHVTIKTSSAVALYILNQKRNHLNELEERFGLEIGVDADEMMTGQHLEIVAGEIVDRAPGETPPSAQIAPDAVVVEDDEEEVIERTSGEDNGGERSSRRRRRKRRRGGDGNDSESRDRNEVEASDDGDDNSVEADAQSDDEDGEGERRGRRRRGRRGGRRHRREDDATETVEANAEAADAEPKANGADTDALGAADDGEADPVQAVNGSDRGQEVIESPAAEDATDADAEAAAEDLGEEEPAQAAAPEADAKPEAEDETPPAPEKKSEPRQRRVGWWQRRSFF